jgi:hypothetical protein
VQAAAAVGHLGIAAVLPAWATSAFAPGQVTQVRLPFLSSLEAPLRLAWSNRQLGVRPFLEGLAKELGQSLAR